MGRGSLCVAVPVYNGATTADISLPGEILAATLEARVHLVGAELEWVAGVEPSRPIAVSDRYEDLPHPDVVLIPGGLGWRAQVDDERCMHWLRVACPSAAGVLCVSTGSLLLAATGLLDDQQAAGHWLGHGTLAELGAQPVADRVRCSADGRLHTASGALAAAAAARSLADRLQWGRAPDPPGPRTA